VDVKKKAVWNTNNAREKEKKRRRSRKGTRSGGRGDRTCISAHKKKKKKSKKKKGGETPFFSRKEREASIKASMKQESRRESNGLLHPNTRGKKGGRKKGPRIAQLRPHGGVAQHYHTLKKRKGEENLSCPNRKKPF